MIWRCPKCTGKLASRDDRLECVKCRASYDVVAGIPDLRFPSSDEIVADRTKARTFVEETAGLSVGEMVQRSFRSRADMSERLATRRSAMTMAEPAKLELELESWLDSATRPPAAADRHGVFLDLGCGMGGLLAAAASNGRRGIGIDNRLEMLVIARAMIEAFGGTPVLAAASGDALPLANSAVTGVVLYDVIEHVGDVAAVLRESERVVMPGGHVAISTPNRFSLSAEPHVFLWGVGWLPRRLQAGYVHWRGRQYEHTALLSPREAARLVRKYTRMSLSLTVPQISLQDAALFSTRKAMLAKIYNRVAGWTPVHGVLLLVGPFFRAVGTKPLRVPQRAGIVTALGS